MASSRPSQHQRKRMTRQKSASTSLSSMLVPILAVRKAAVVTAFVAIICIVSPFVLHRKVDPTSHPDWVPSSPSRYQPQSSAPLPDICRVANAMSKRPLQFSSYTNNGAHKPIGWPKHIPHVSSIICDRITSRPPITSSATKPWSINDIIWKHHDTAPAVKSIFSFKSARSGSTFFTSVVTRVLRDRGRPTTKYWEPSFCSNLNQHSPGIYREAEYQAQSLRMLLTSKCNMERGGCKPAKECRQETVHERGKEPVYVVAMNPRFLNQTIDWSGAVGGMGDSLRIFTLRRTNLVLMAYSKFHHGGCRIDKSAGGMSPYWRRRLKDAADEEITNDTLPVLVENDKGKRRRNGQFTFERMLQCIHHYAIGDQELSISSAFSASISSKSSADPYLILYEDVLSSGSIVEEGLLRHLHLGTTRIGASSTDLSATGSVFENNRTKKVHSDPLCHYNDVSCSELELGLRNATGKKYPCLWKQYQQAEEGLTWSMPLLPSGLVSLEGDCFPLEALDEKKRTRTVDELYRLPPR